MRKGQGQRGDRGLSRTLTSGSFLYPSLVPQEGNIDGGLQTGPVEKGRKSCRGLHLGSLKGQKDKEELADRNGGQQKGHIQQAVTDTQTPLSANTMAALRGQRGGKKTGIKCQRPDLGQKSGGKIS